MMVDFGGRTVVSKRCQVWSISVALLYCSCWLNVTLTSDPYHHMWKNGAWVYLSELCLFICFETGSHVSEDLLKLPIQLKINLNFWSSCLYFPSKGITNWNSAGDQIQDSGTTGKQFVYKLCFLTLSMNTFCSFYHLFILIPKIQGERYVMTLLVLASLILTWYTN